MVSDSPRRILLVPSSLFFFLIVPSLTWLLGGWLDGLMRLAVIQLPVQSGVLFMPLIIIGGYFVSESVRMLFCEGGGVPLGDLFPSDQSKALITLGVYSKTRNPMLFGYILCLCGLGLIEGSLSSAFLLPLVYLVLWTTWIKLKEEPALEKRFGEKYTKYRDDTPFLLPRLFH